jgi:hypothetical protein
MEETMNKGLKAVFTVVERGNRSYWVRVGTGFTNKDGSLNLRLDAIPTNGTLQVRDWESGERRNDALDSRRHDALDPRRHDPLDAPAQQAGSVRLPPREKAFDSVI